MINISLSETNLFSVFYDFYQTHLICFRGFVCFKLLRKKQPRCISFMHHTTLKPCHWFISPEIKVTLTCIIQSHSSLAPTVQAAHQLCCCTVDTRCNFSVCVIICGSEVYLSIFLSIGSIALYICMCCFFCVKVSTLTILYRSRWYELYVLGFIVCFVHDGLFAHLPLQPPPPLNPYCDFYVMMVWTYQMKECVLMHHFNLNAAYWWGFFTVCKEEHWCRSRMAFREVPLSWIGLLSCFLQFYQLGPNADMSLVLREWPLALLKQFWKWNTAWTRPIGTCWHQTVNLTSVLLNGASFMR